MGRVLTNNVGIAFAREETLGVLPSQPSWKLLEPNGISRYGADITTVARDPISPDRQRRKGTVTDLDSGMEFDADWTLDSFEDFVECFLFVNATNSDTRFLDAEAGGSGYIISPATPSIAAKMQFTSGGPISLVYATGYSTAANNGLKPLTADVAHTNTVIEVAGTVAETPSPGAIVEVAGIRAEEGDLAITVVGTQGTLTSGNNAATNNIDFTTLGLTVGQYVHVGGLAAGQQLTGSVGYGRITAINTGSLVMDKLSSTLVDATGAGDTVDLLFGRFLRNVPTNDADFLEQSLQFEAEFPNLGTGGATEYEYSQGNLCNQITFNMPLTDKATATFGFVGTDTAIPTTVRATNAATPRRPTKTSALNTTADIARLRITTVDEIGLTTDFKSLTVTINNNVTPEKVLANLGARFMNFGNFNVDIEGQLLFTNSNVTAAIRNNVTLGLDFQLRNDDGAIVVDIPAMTLGGGGREYPVNETVLINVTGQAFGDPLNNISLGVSIFPVVPLTT